MSLQRLDDVSRYTGHASKRNDEAMTVGRRQQIASVGSNCEAGEGDAASVCVVAHHDIDRAIICWSRDGESAAVGDVLIVSKRSVDGDVSHR